MLSILILNSGRLINSKNAASFDAHVKSQVELIAATLAESLAVFDVARLNDNLKSIAEFSQITYIAIYTTHKKKIAFIGEEPADFKQDHSYQDAMLDGSYDLKKEIVVAGQILGYLCIGYSITEVEKITQEAVVHNSIIAIIEIILSVAVTIFLGIYIIRRINTLKEGAIALGNNKLDYRIPVTQNDELGDLAKSFNQLAISLEHSRNTVDEQYGKLQKMHDKALSATKAKSNFLANMSHEIRTPMNAILGYTQLLHIDSEIPAKQKGKIEKILRSGNHLLRIINEILDISKIESGRETLTPIVFNLNDLARSLSDMFSYQCEEKGLDWSFILDADLGDSLVVGDEGKLRQVLINLLGNAIKFTETGGVTLRISCESTQIYCFDIVDTGIGISANDQKTIFKPFNQGAAGTLKGGTGLGLTISKNLIKLMGGDLKLSSSTESGSYFSFTLCLHKADDTIHSQQQGEIENQDVDFHNLVSTLVVDDNADNRIVLQQMLTSMGCDCVTVDSGYAALDDKKLCEYDIIFMDYKMPGIDGIYTTEQVRLTCGKSPKIIMTTASAFDHDIKRFYKAGADSILSKPITLNNLKKELLQLLPPVTPISEKSSSKTSDNQIDLNDIPERLRSDIIELAELGQITDMNVKIAELELTHKDLGELLTGYSASMKLDEISMTLQQQKTN
ncbi:MAG: ATP-binding protein [Thiohalomonadales bacterium]